MSPIKFTQSIQINKTPETVFDYTQDYSKRLTWDTFLIQADLIENAAAAGKGVKAWCVAKNGMGMETEYVTFNRPKVTAIKMTKGPYLFKSFLGSWSFREMPSDNTEVTFLYSFALRFPFNMMAFAIKRNLQNNVKQRLKDLKGSLELEVQS